MPVGPQEKFETEYDALKQLVDKFTEPFTGSGPQHVAKVQGRIALLFLREARQLNEGTDKLLRVTWWLFSVTVVLLIATLLLFAKK